MQTSACMYDFAEELMSPLILDKTILQNLREGASVESYVFLMDRVFVLLRRHGQDNENMPQERRSPCYCISELIVYPEGTRGA